MLYKSRLLKRRRALRSAAHDPAGSSTPSRHWADAALSIAAIVISALSLWVAIDTNKTNHQLVMEASWPFMQIYASGEHAFGTDSSNGSGPKVLSLDISNAGVGPAKIESFELFWRGRPYRSASELMRDCCDYNPTATDRSATSPAADHALGTSEIAGTVLRAGDVVPIIRFALTTTNANAWAAFSSQRFKLSSRICYCSVFNECWMSDIQAVGGEHTLNPRSVSTCPRPPVPYIE